MILAGDIGGTKTVLGLFEDQGGHLNLVSEGTFPSRDHPSLETILGLFLKDKGSHSFKAGCFGVAGAVVNGKVKTTNLPWLCDEVELARAIGAPRVKLLNDLEAAAYGMMFLQPAELVTLHEGQRPPRPGNIAVIAAGTGLGEAMLYWDGERHHPIASEGGHASFAPQLDVEIELLRYLRGKFGGHVSYERVLSGPGFYNIYEFLRATGYGVEPDWLTEKLEGGDPVSALGQVALSGQEPMTAKALELFTYIYGAEAGNLALQCVAVGGVYIGGGIAPKNIKALQTGSFMRGFLHKGRFAEFLRGIDVRVALNPRAPLIGAAHYALRL